MSVQVFTSLSFRFVREAIEQMFGNSILDLEFQVKYEKDYDYNHFPPEGTSGWDQTNAHARFLVFISRRSHISNIQTYPEVWKKQFLDSLRDEATKTLHSRLSPLQDNANVVYAGLTYNNAISFSMLANTYFLGHGLAADYNKFLTSIGYSNTIFSQPYHALTEYLLFRQLPDTDHFLLPFSNQPLFGLREEQMALNQNYLKTVPDRFTLEDKSRILRYTKGSLLRVQNNVMELYTQYLHLLPDFHTVIGVGL